MSHIGPQRILALNGPSDDESRGLESEVCRDRVACAMSQQERQNEDSPALLAESTPCGSIPLWYLMRVRNPPSEVGDTRHEDRGKKDRSDTARDSSASLEPWGRGKVRNP